MFSKVKKLSILSLLVSLVVSNSYSNASDSLNLANNNAPKWQGMDIFKHLNDYKTANLEDYHIKFPDGPKNYSDRYFFSTGIINGSNCQLNYSSDPIRSVSCFAYPSKKNIDLYPNAKSMASGPVSNPVDLTGNYRGEHVNILKAGQKIFIAKVNNTLFEKAIREDSVNSYRDNVSLTCVSAIDNNVACRNSNNHGFVTEGAKVTTF